jgi:hypothetical protein
MIMLPKLVGVITTRAILVHAWLALGLWSAELKHNLLGRTSRDSWLGSALFARMESQHPIFAHKTGSSELTSDIG